jgi:RNA polymerase sigma factor (sigma-70 family)
MEPRTTRVSLLSRVRDPRDGEAWMRFEATYGDLIVRYARARGLGFHDALDARQIVLTRLATALRGFQYDPARGRFRTYLGAVVRSVVFRLTSCPRASTARLDEEWAGIPEAAAGDTEAQASWDREWALHHTRMARARLVGEVEARSLEVFDRLLMGDSVEAVAGMFGLSSAAVHKIKQRIRDRMKALVADQVRDEEFPDDLGRAEHTEA